MSYIMTWLCFVLWTFLSLAFPIIHMLSANGRGRANAKAEGCIYLPVQSFLVAVVVSGFWVCVCVGFFKHTVFTTELCN